MVGLYGVTIGKGCFGESMFSFAETDVSKMAFIPDVPIGQGKSVAWIDCQLGQRSSLFLGAHTISPKSTLKSLQDVIIAPINWKNYQERVFSSKTKAVNAKKIRRLMD